MPSASSAEPSLRRANVSKAAAPSAGMSKRERDRRIDAVKAALARARARHLGRR